MAAAVVGPVPSIALSLKEVRDEVLTLYSKQIQALCGGKVNAGKSNSSFIYGIFLNGTPLKNDSAPVRLNASVKRTKAAQLAEESVTNLEEPAVHWVLEANLTLRPLLPNQR